MGSAKPVSIPKTVSLSRPRPNLEYARPSWVAEGSQMGRRLPNLNCEPPICVSSTLCVFHRIEPITHLRLGPAESLRAGNTNLTNLLAGPLRDLNCKAHLRPLAGIPPGPAWPRLVSS